MSPRKQESTSSGPLAFNAGALRETLSIELTTYYLDFLVTDTSGFLKKPSVGSLEQRKLDPPDNKRYQSVFVCFNLNNKVF